MLVGYMRVSSESDRQNTDLQKDALFAAGVDNRHIFEDRASGAKDNRPGGDVRGRWGQPRFLLDSYLHFLRTYSIGRFLILYLHILIV